MRYERLLSCERCTVNCCDHKTAFRGGKIKLFPCDKQYFNEENSDHMKMVNSRCQYSTSNRCPIYKDRPVTCWSYPFMVDSDDKLYFSTTCPRYNELISQLMLNDVELTKDIQEIHNKLKELPDYVKKHWTDLINTYKIAIRIEV